MKIKATLVEAHIMRKNRNRIEYLLMKRSPEKRYPNIWQMVTGAVEKNEKGFEAALREIKEETGITPNNLWIVPNVNSFYSDYDDSINMVPVFVAETDFSQSVKLSDEHCEYKWCSMNEALGLLAWPGQRKSLAIIEEYFNTNNSLLNLIKIKDGEL